MIFGHNKQHLNMGENASNEIGCVRCKSTTIKTGFRCRNCGRLSHKSCLKDMKNVKYYKDDTITCCDSEGVVSPSKDKSKKRTSSSSSTSSVYLPNAAFLGGDNQNIADKITIKYLEEIIRQKDEIIKQKELVISTQVLAIEALTEQIKLIKHSVQQRNVISPSNSFSENPNNLRLKSISNHRSTNISSNLKQTVNGRNMLTGTNTNSTCPFKAAAAVISEDSKPNIKILHAMNFEPDTDATELSNYLKTLAPNVNVQKLNSRHPDIYASFKIIVPSDECDKLLVSDIWPEKVVLNRFLFRKKSTVSNK